MAKFSKILRDNNIVFIVIILAVVFYIFNPRFLSLENVTAITRQIVPIGFLVLGQFFVIVSGNIDLSMGMLSVLLSIILGVVFGTSGMVLPGVLMVLFSSLLFGYFNGIFVGKVKIPAFIVTLSTLFVATGLSGIVIPRGKMIFLTHQFFKFWGSAKIFGVYYSFLVMILMFVVAYFFYNHTKYGAYIVAIGDNENNAKMVGINVEKMKIIIFMISGFFSGMAGIIISSRMGFVQPGLDGTGMLMDAITAIIIGGTLLSGGKGKIGGIFWGLLFIGIINNSLNLLNVQDIWHQVFKGLVIIGALAMNWMIVKKDISERNLTQAA